MLQARLKVIGGKYDGQGIPLTSQKFLIGRESDCHLRTNSELISRHHCVFSVDEYAVRLRDLGSTNGTFVNGERVPGQVVLNPGDRIRIGRLEFELEIPVEAPVAETPIPGASAVSTPLIEPAAGSDEGAETAYELPVDASAADSETTVGYNSEDTAVLPAAQPQFDPQQQPGYYPQFYPQYPQQGYPPPGYYPQYGAPYPPPGGYPQGPGYFPPGYGPQGYPPPPQPQQQPDTAGGDPRDRGGNVPSPPVRLPDPETTGAQAPAPKTPAANGSESKAELEKTPSERAAEIIKQRMQRRLQGS